MQANGGHADKHGTHGNSADSAHHNNHNRAHGGHSASGTSAEASADTAAGTARLKPRLLTSTALSAMSFWGMHAKELLRQLGTSEEGLASHDARRRLRWYGPNLLKPKKKRGGAELFLSQFRSPLVIILIFAALIAFFVGEQTNAAIIFAIVLVSGALGFWQERGATNIVQRLLSMVQVKATLLRDGVQKEVPVDDIVPGDIVVLQAGALVPGDCLLLESKDLFADESALTGEPYPVEKSAGVLRADTPPAKRMNSLFMGTHVVSGSALAVVVRTGASTEFSKISKRLEFRLPETEFEHGVRKFGFLLMKVTAILVIAVFAINVYLARPLLESFLFALALAVGLTPQLLPAIISVNLAHGARYMAKKKVIVKRLASIENFGSMNVLCADKTGTLTEGKIHVKAGIGVFGNENEKVMQYAYINALYETGFKNPIDHAIRSHKKFDTSDWKKLDEVPYDFSRKRLSILAANGRRNMMVTKGAVQNVLAICSRAETSEGRDIEIGRVQGDIQKHFEELSSKGFRVIGVAYKETPKDTISRHDEADMVFLGFLVLSDPLKKGIAGTVKHLKDAGVSLKMVTGDNRLIAASIGKEVGLSELKLATGSDIAKMKDDVLLKRINDIDIFAEIEPEQKERIILALRKTGNVVGFLGDGINDAPALHAADVGISVDKAVDIGKQAADIVLLEKDLSVLLEGVREGRKTFINTRKYVFMATSSNFGNMFSMAGASLFLPFLPLLPTQILLMNLLTDCPEMTIATDNVDPEMLERPHRWDIKFIRKFMVTFGLLSSVFDYLTFGVLIFVLGATTDVFRTGWFLESVLSAGTIILVIRSRRPFFKSRPGRLLAAAIAGIVCLTIAIPFTPLAEVFQFVPLPACFVLVVIGLVAAYLVLAEATKRIFYRRVASA